MYFPSVGTFSSTRFAVMPALQPNSIITLGATLLTSATKIAVSCWFRYRLNGPRSGTAPSSAPDHRLKSTRPIVGLGLAAQPHILIPRREPSPACPMRQQPGHARMADGSGQMQRRGIDADDLIHAHHHRGAIGEVFELMSDHAQLARLVGVLRLNAVDFHVAQGLDQLPNRNFARIVAPARLAYRPCDADPLLAGRLRRWH